MKTKKYACQYFMVSDSYMVYTNSKTKPFKDFIKINNCYKIKIFDGKTMELIETIK